MTLDEMVQCCFNAASKEFLAHDKGICPLLVAFSDEGIAGIMPAPWHNDHEKKQMVMFFTNILHAHGCSGYAVVSEIWSVTRKIPAGEKLGPEHFNPAIMPSEDTDRVNCLMVMAEKTDQSTMRLWEIKRSPNGKVSGFEARSLENCMVKSPLFNGLLSQDPKRAN